MTDWESLIDMLAIIVHAAWWSAIIIGILVLAGWLEWQIVNAAVNFIL